MPGIVITRSCVLSAVLFSIRKFEIHRTFMLSFASKSRNRSHTERKLKLYLIQDSCTGNECQQEGEGGEIMVQESVNRSDNRMMQENIKEGWTKTLKYCTKVYLTVSLRNT